MTTDNIVFTIIKVEPDLSVCVLHTTDSQQSAIHYLTKHLNEEYELENSLNYKVYQKSESTFDVYRIGYLYKSLDAIYHIVTVNLL